MFVGPVFTREVVTVPRRIRFYISRAVYVAALLVLMWTAWLLLTGTQVIRNVGDVARFGSTLFQILAPLQLALCLFFSALLAASAVAQEKDRRTLVLLLLTNLTNSELVLGKLLASMLNVLVLLAASLPVFMLSALFGGISFEQIARVFAVSLVTALVCGSLGSTVALWRESTFHTLAATLLVLGFWLAAGEAVARGALGDQWGGIPAETWAVTFSPWQAILTASRPALDIHADFPIFGNAIYVYLLVGLGLTLVLNGIAIGFVRVWNPSREIRGGREESASEESIWGPEHDLVARGQRTEGAHFSLHAPRSVHAAPGKTRKVWNSPVIWREVCTWAYGRKVLIIRLAYLTLFGLAAFALVGMLQAEAPATRTSIALVLVPLFVLSLVLVNAQAVTSVTTERDIKALDLLLVTDLTPKEFVFGKLGGALYNTKEMVLLPIALCVYLWYAGGLAGENLIYLVGGLLVLYAFAAMLGVHSGMIYENSRSAIAVSLGTIFFLFLGIATCMRMMVAFSGSFEAQVSPFLAFMAGGALGLYVALGARNPSSAIFWASLLCPIATFYAIASYLLGHTLGVFLVTLFTYGFTTAAMLIPAIFEFDVATGRTTSGDE